MISEADILTRRALELEAKLAERDATIKLQGERLAEAQKQLTDVCGLYAAALDHVTDADRQAEEARSAKDAAYSERNQCVAFMAKMARALGWTVFRGLHDEADAAWERDWRTIVFIIVPGAGQLSWHFHDSELPLVQDLPRADGNHWDGHTTEQKYERMRSWRP